MASTCTIDNCDKIVNGHGMCKAHYMNWYREERKRNGNKDLTTYHQKVDPEPGGPLGRTREWTKEDLEGFWGFVKKELNLT